MKVDAKDNKCIGGSPTRDSLPETIVRRSRYWEKDCKGLPLVESTDEALDRVRFLINQIYSDPDINMNTCLGRYLSAEELMGILLSLRRYLVIMQTDERLREGGPRDYDVGIRLRIIDLKMDGFGHDQIKELVRREYPPEVTTFIHEKMARVGC